MLAKGFEPTGHTYRALLEGYAASKDRSGVEATFEAMKEKKIKLNARDYALVMSSWLGSTT